jgi:hypothetical protein
MDNGVAIMFAVFRVALVAVGSLLGVILVVYFGGWVWLEVEYGPAHGHGIPNAAGAFLLTLYGIRYWFPAWLIGLVGWIWWTIRKANR